MRYLPIAIALAVLHVGITHAAAPSDGGWKGSWSGVSNVGTGSYNCTSYHGNVDMTIANGQVSGTTTGQFQGAIAGTVATDGKFIGHIAQYNMSGRFSGKRFQGRFTTSKCAMSVSAKPTGG